VNKELGEKKGKDLISLIAQTRGGRSIANREIVKKGKDFEPRCKASQAFGKKSSVGYRWDAAPGEKG